MKLFFLYFSSFVWELLCDILPSFNYSSRTIRVLTRLSLNRIWRIVSWASGGNSEFENLSGEFAPMDYSQIYDWNERHGFTQFLNSEIPSVFNDKRGTSSPIVPCKSKRKREGTGEPFESANIVKVVHRVFPTGHRIVSETARRWWRTKRTRNAMTTGLPGF